MYMHGTDQCWKFLLIIHIPQDGLWLHFGNAQDGPPAILPVVGKLSHSLGDYMATFFNRGNLGVVSPHDLFSLGDTFPYLLFLVVSKWGQVSLENEHLGEAARPRRQRYNIMSPNRKYWKVQNEHELIQERPSGSDHQCNQKSREGHQDPQGSWLGKREVQN